MGVFFIALMVIVVVMCLVHVLPNMACRIGLVDEPDCRKHHEGCVPLVGGLAMFCGFCVGMSLLEDPWVRFPALILGGLLLLTVGLLDDLREMRKRVRVPAQIVAALLLIVVGGVVLRDLGWLAFGNLLALGVLALPFTIFCTVGVLNAMNMSDGLDGLAGGLALITLGSLAYLANGAGMTGDLDALVVLMAALVGFLVFNARSPWCKKAKVFMGDAGSLFLGFVIARFLIDFSQGEERIMHPVTALWVFAVPLMDTVAVMMRRMVSGKSPFSADRKHLHHVLLSKGLSVQRTVILIWALALVLAAIGILGHNYGLADGLMFAGFLALFVVYTWVLSYLGRETRDVSQATATAGASAAESSGRVS